MSINGKKYHSGIIDNESKGNVWALAIWPGQGMNLDVYLVRAEDIQPAIDKVFKWIWDNEPRERNELIYDYTWVSERALEDFNSYNDTDYSFDELADDENMYEKYQKFESEDIAKNFQSNSEYTLFALEENFEVHEVPEELIANMNLRNESKNSLMSQWTKRYLQSL